ncbi:MAG: DUF2934 domain-containing protein [Candidatus Omnitrophica bacterium]|nr:DUF2934 domain-containing protein [Candidatus Omnitrophota bacterium]
MKTLIQAKKPKMVSKVKQEVQREKKVDAVRYSQMVEKKAYELFEKRGCHNGQDWEDWFKAEKLVEEELCQK